MAAQKLKKQDQVDVSVRKEPNNPNDSCYSLGRIGYVVKECLVCTMKWIPIAIIQYSLHGSFVTRSRKRDHSQEKVEWQYEPENVEIKYFT